MISAPFQSAAVSAPQPQPDWAMFFDLDGTLLDIAPGPDDVVTPASLVPALAAARDWLGGALAIVSGRTVEKIDEFLAPLKFPCAGEHGAVLRMADGTIRRAGNECVVPDSWKQAMRRVVQNWDGVIVDDKAFSIALHYRAVPERGEDVRRLVENIVAANSKDFEVLPAQMAYEIRHRSLNKGTAVRSFMAEPVFHGRRPVFVGDDVTDEDGFRAATELGGLGLHVKHAFSGEPTNVRRWLERFK